MAGVATIGMKLSYGSSASSLTALTNCQSFPSLRVGAQDFDQIEVTTTDDSEHKFINGLKAESDDMEFTFLYDQTQFTTLAGLSGSQYWAVEIPGTGTKKKFTFQGTCKVEMDSVGVNEALTYTLTIVKPYNFAFA